MGKALNGESEQATGRERPVGIDRKIYSVFSRCASCLLICVGARGCCVVRVVRVVGCVFAGVDGLVKVNIHRMQGADSKPSFPPSTAASPFA